jgi:Mn2+/Fe2+ NRAMP family transporter
VNFEIMALKTNLRHRLTHWLSTVGPGIFLIGYNIGTGSVTTMAASGSRYGMSLFWALFLSCVFTFVMLVAYGKYTIVTDRTAISSYKTYFGKAISIFVMFGLILGEIAALMGIMGIVVNLIDEWIVYITGHHVNKIIVTLFIIAGLYYLFWVGAYIRFEKILMVFVTIMGICFVSSMVLVVPEPSEVIKGLVPQIPQEGNAHLIAAGMAGTTLSAVLFVMRSIVVKEKGWGINDLKIEKRDAFVSAIMMLILSGAIMACAAGTLYRMGIPVDRAVDMVSTLEPIAGKFAITLFVIGIVSAGLSTVFPIILIAPWLISDYSDKPRNIKSNLYRILAASGLLLGLIVPVFGGRPVFIMIASQAFQALLMPMVTIAIIIFFYRHDIMKDYKIELWLRIGLWATFLFSLVMAYSGFVGLIEMLD